MFPFGCGEEEVPGCVPINPGELSSTLAYHMHVWW